jgi:uncharacterized protein DUF4058
MPLLDHFHDPVFSSHPWESFHAAWAAEIMAWLNQRLPRRYFATMYTHLGLEIAADVAEFELDPSPDDDLPNGSGNGGVAVEIWAPPKTALAMPAVYPDDLEVRVHDAERDRKVVAVVELVSPGNKDRPETRRAFAAKCAAYLQHGIGVVTVDIVTSRHFNVHNELVRLLGLREPFLMAEEVALYAVAYRPARRGDVDQIDLWQIPLAVGGALPLLPLALRGRRAVPLDLEATYTETRLRSRL